MYERERGRGRERERERKGEREGGRKQEISSMLIVYLFNILSHNHLAINSTKPPTQEHATVII